PAPLSFFTIEFSKDIAPASFPVASVRLQGPSGAVPNVTVQRVDARHFKISFGDQRTGQFTLTVLPTVTDLLGNRLDQNGNGVGGEAGDSFTLAFVVTSPDLVVASTTIPSAAHNG